MVQSPSNTYASLSQLAIPNSNLTSSTTVHIFPIAQQATDSKGHTMRSICCDRMINVCQTSNQFQALCHAANLSTSQPQKPNLMTQYRTRRGIVPRTRMCTSTMVFVAWSLSIHRRFHNLSSLISVESKLTRIVLHVPEIDLEQIQ